MRKNALLPLNRRCVKALATLNDGEVASATSAQISKQPTKTLTMSKEITIHVPDGKRAEWINGVLTLVDEQKVDKRPVTERVKTFEDACSELGETNVLVQAYRTAEFNISGNLKDILDVIAYIKLRIICAALNEGWKPQFTEHELRWYPWFTLWTEEELKDKSEEWKADKKLWLFGGTSANASACGLASAASRGAWASSRSDCSARLAVKSEELAEYFGKQFIDIWADFLFS